MIHQFLSQNDAFALKIHGGKRVARENKTQRRQKPTYQEINNKPEVAMLFWSCKILVTSPGERRLQLSASAASTKRAKISWFSGKAVSWSGPWQVFRRDSFCWTRHSLSIIFRALLARCANDLFVRNVGKASVNFCHISLKNEATRNLQLVSAIQPSSLASVFASRMWSLSTMRSHYCYLPCL